MVYHFFTHPYVQNMIRFKAREMARQFGLCDADRDDIEQELRLDILKRAERYDSAKSSIATFSNRIITHRIASLIQERQAECRDWRLEISLQEQCPDQNDGEATWEDFLDGEGNLGPVKTRLSPDHEAADMRMDIAHLLNLLSPEQRAFCLRLREQTVAEIAAETGIPASTLYDLRRKLRLIFKDLHSNLGFRP